MKPVTGSEMMMFNTVRLECPDKSSGTGFFFNFKIGESVIPTIITNKHVVNNNPKEIMKFHLHLQNSNDPEDAIDQSFSVSFQTEWIFHPSQDLCFTFVNPLFQEVYKRTGKRVFFIPISEDIIYDQNQLNNLSALEPVVMVGYPNGLWDKVHNFPLFRRGYTSAHPAIDFNKKSIGVVDMACFPGSSGSPIFILNETGYQDKTSKSFNLQSRIVFLGILSKGPQIIECGDLVEVKMKQKIVPVVRSMINLGYYIKSYELDEFRKIIAKIISAEDKT